MNIAIVLSGGTGTRLNSQIPKQYIEVDGKMIIMYSLEVIMKNKMIDGLVIVADESYHKCILAGIEKVGNKKPVTFACPGKTRQLSIYNALISSGMKDATTVFIHDAARPNITDDMITDYISKLENYDGVLPVLPMKDTVYEVDNGIIKGLLKRENIYAGQAPEVFVYDKYLKANEKLLPDDIMSINGSTEPAVLSGMNIRTVNGDENNYKITTNIDLEKFIKSKVIE